MRERKSCRGTMAVEERGGRRVLVAGGSLLLYMCIECSGESTSLLAALPPLQSLPASTMSTSPFLPLPPQLSSSSSSSSARMASRVPPARASPLTVSPPRGGEEEAVAGEGEVSLGEWQRWGTSSPMPSLVAKVVRDLMALEVEVGAPMSFGGLGGKLQGDFRVQEDRKHRALYQSMVDSEEKLRYFSARQIACRLLGSRRHLCQKELEHKTLNFVLLDGTWSNSAAMFSRLKERAKPLWGEDDVPCLSLITLGASAMHKLRPQPSWDHTCTAAAAAGLLSELHLCPDFVNHGLDKQANAVENALDVLLDALVGRRRRMGRSFTRGERNNLC